MECDAKGYRLPTEAECEYSARGGEYHKYSGSDNVDEVAWYSDNSEIHPVGQKKPNGFGLYDMSGNVWNGYGIMADGYYSSGSPTDPTGPDVQKFRVLRGGPGTSSLGALACRTATIVDPAFRRRDLGFRLVRTP